MVNLDVIAKYKSENLSLKAKTDDEEVTIKPATLEDAVWLAEKHKVPLENYQRIIREFTEDDRAVMFILGYSGGPFGQASLQNITDDGNANYTRILRMVQDVTKGGMTAAVKEINRFGFEEVGLNKAFLSTDKNNSRAREFYDRCGFVVVSEVPFEHVPDSNLWRSNPDLKGKAERYQVYMELTRERFEFLYK
jgi:RimJ/RimL family protein N-acetyltransferase